MLIIFLLLLSSAINADYVTVGNNNYSITSSSCPTGQVCDYVYNQATIISTIATRCNASLYASLSNLTNLNHTNGTNVFNFIQEFNLTNTSYDNEQLITYEIESFL